MINKNFNIIMMQFTFSSAHYIIILTFIFNIYFFYQIFFITINKFLRFQYLVKVCILNIVYIN